MRYKVLHNNFKNILNNFDKYGGLKMDLNFENIVYEIMNLKILQINIKKMYARI